MQKEFQHIRTAFKAEWLKTKGLGLLYFATGIAVLLPVLSFIIAIFNKSSRIYEGPPISGAEKMLYGGLSGFSGFFLLLFIIIAATRIAQTDHKNNGWVFLETQPLSKLSIYTAKFLTVLVLSVISITVYYISCLVVGTIDLAIFPRENLTYSIDFAAVLHGFVRSVIMALGIISFQMMLSVMIPGFIWPFVIGFIGFVINIVGEIRAETYDFVVYNNQNTSLNYANPNELNTFLTYSDVLSIFWAVLFFIIGYLAYSRRGVKNAFFKTGKRTAFSLAGIAVAAGIFFFLTRPVIHDRQQDLTVIEGKVNSLKPVSEIIIQDYDFGQKITAIPVKDGKFRWESKYALPFGLYKITVGEKSDFFIMSEGDHVELIVGMSDKKFQVYHKGSRNAEKYYLDNNEKKFSVFYDEYVKDKKLTSDPEKFYESAQEEWDDQLKQISKFRTKENVHVGEDFKKYVTQLNAAKMLNAITDYRTMTSFADKKFAPPVKFEQELKETVKEPVELVLANEEFNQWKLKQLLPPNQKSSDSLILAKLALMKPGTEKDRLLRTQLKSTFEKTKDEANRNEIAAVYMNQFQDPKFRTDMEKQLFLIKSQQKGAPFPPIVFEDALGKTTDMSQFKGKYVVIDFWATWCAPCKETSPVFDYQADEYRYLDHMVFVAASIDRDKNKWKLDIKNKEFNVTNLWVKNQELLSQVGVDAIPRFMVIDPEGKIYNANMPRPQETNFTDILDEISSRSNTRYIRF